jgi:hypothetical protein
MMFGRTKTKRPNRPFVHSDGCKIVKADPGVSRGRRSSADTGRPAASAEWRTSTRSPPTTVLGSTRSIRRPAATWGSASSPPRQSPPGSGSSCRRLGPGLLVGDV